jgi:hypothetical protein
METTFGANSAPTGVRARGRSFQDGEFHSPPGSEKVWASIVSVEAHALLLNAVFTDRPNQKKTQRILESQTTIQF